MIKNMISRTHVHNAMCKLASGIDKRADWLDSVANSIRSVMDTGKGNPGEGIATRIGKWRGNRQNAEKNAMVDRQLSIENRRAQQRTAPHKQAVASPTKNYKVAPSFQGPLPKADSVSSPKPNVGSRPQSDPNTRVDANGDTWKRHPKTGQWYNANRAQATNRRIEQHFAGGTHASVPAKDTNIHRGPTTMAEYQLTKNGPYIPQQLAETRPQPVKQGQSTSQQVGMTSNKGRYSYKVDPTTQAARSANQALTSNNPNGERAKLFETADKTVNGAFSYGDPTYMATLGRKYQVDTINDYNLLQSLRTDITPEQRQLAEARYRKGLNTATQMQNALRSQQSEQQKQYVAGMMLRRKPNYAHNFFAQVG